MKSIQKYRVQLVRENSFQYNGGRITEPRRAYEAVEKTLNLSFAPKENFGFLALNTKNDVIGIHVISVGSINSTIVHPRDVYAAACENNAASILLFHNHPSGDPSPSNDDIQITKRLCEAGKIMGIEVLDHIIIGETSYISLRERGSI